MKGSQRRKFAYGVAQHTCIRGVRSSVLFYTVEDYLWYLTLYSCLSNKYDVVTLAFCIMPNHTHEIVSCSSMQNLVLFRHELERLFSREYNHVRGLNGTEFRGPFANSLKPAGKRLKGALLYVLNNPVAGFLVERAVDYRWNLLAYHDSDHPFSTAIDRRTCSRAMRRSLKLLDYYVGMNYPLRYDYQKLIFAKLSENEKFQIIDQIIASYSFIDYGAMVESFGSFNNLLIAVDASEGSEYDLHEEWEDYSCYQKMLETAYSDGLISVPHDFRAMSEQFRNSLYIKYVRMLNGREKQVRRFLHL